MLTTLPNEIQETIVVDCARIQPKLIAVLAQVCQSLRKAINQAEDGFLWRNIFLLYFDDPRLVQSIDVGCSQLSECWVDWQLEAQRRFRAGIRMDRAALREIREFDQVVDDDAADALFETACSAHPATTDEISKNVSWIEKCFQAALLPPVTSPAHAKLYTIATFLATTTSATLGVSSAKSRLPSRAYTYDMRNYTADTKWGPWLPKSNGAVNWMHQWFLIDVLRHNAHERACKELPLHGIGNFQAYSMPQNTDSDLKPESEKGVKWNDWAGVQGMWLRCVSFMDYRDLHAYNFSGTDEHGNLSSRIFQDMQFAEAFRLIKAYFTVTKVEEEGPPNYRHRPTIHFTGDAAIPPGGPAQYHHITHGTVSMTKHGHVRWSFQTRVGGHQWSSEGVQLGNVQSAAGVVGVWSSAIHEDSDPCGPFWAWKIPGSAKTPPMHLYNYT